MSGWRPLPPFGPSASRLVQLANEFHVRRKRAARAAKEQTKASPNGDEAGVSNAVYLDPPPREWDEAWQLCEQALARGAWQEDGAPLARRWLPMDSANPWPLGHAPMLG